MRFLSGGLFHTLFSVPGGQVECRAIVMSEGRKLTLWDASITAVSDAGTPIGVSGLHSVVRQLCRMAADEGFDTVTISGYRISGASPGREASLTFRCPSNGSRQVQP